MQIIEQISELRNTLKGVRQNGNSVGLVPTMGAFHEGHLTLMRQAKAQNDVVVVTLFVNPTQFNETEDFKHYPRDLELDIKMATEVGVDYLFTPTSSQIYPNGFDTEVITRGLSQRLEGASRPGHFAGVATVVTKLLNIIQANQAFFGEKDWQQLQVIRQLRTDLNIPTDIVSVPTVREPDGLAMSSRNIRLTPEQRNAAIVISQALDTAQKQIESGIVNIEEITLAMSNRIHAEPLATLDYAVIVHPETLTVIDSLHNGAIAAIAAKFGNIRLIDNRLLH